MTAASHLVDEFRERSLSPGRGRIVDIIDVASSPDGAWIAFTGVRGGGPTEVGRSSVYLVEVDTGSLTDIRAAGSLPAWSADGTLLAYHSGPSKVTIRTIATGSERSYSLPGIVEYLRFASRAARVLVGVAEAGADRSGADGSGALDDADESGTELHVEGARGSAGWRWVLSIECNDGSVRRMSPEGCNVWEADWCADRVIAVASEFPEEGGWYDARIVAFDGPDSTPTVLVSSDAQLGVLAASPDGQALAFVQAVCSDRGVIAGDAKILDLRSREVITIESADTDVTALAWRADSTLLAAGQRRLDTVVAEVTANRRWRELWSSGTRSCGSWYPSAVPIASAEGPAFAAALHGYGRPPVLTVVTGSTERPLVDTDHPGTRYVRRVGGALRPVTWQAPDGLDIEGLLAVPGSAGPHPLIVLIHGGPVAAYRPSWQLIYGWTSLLAAAGYAVLHPNPRGSGGRGQGFARLVLGDMGGADTQDFTSAVDALADRGLIDPARVAVLGRSYGGYMASWLVTQDDRFTAAVPMAPVTNWTSQHFTSNLGGFDEAFLADTVTNSAGKFLSRSPVFYADRVTAAVLNITGARDRCTPPTQAIEFHRALIEHDVDSTLVVYPDEGHHLDSPAATADALRRILGFLGDHLPAG